MKRISKSDLWHREMRNRLRFAKLLKRTQLRPKSVAHYRKLLKVFAPANFNLSENYHDTVSCLQELKEASLNSVEGQRRHIPSIDLRPIQKISLASALVLAAEIDRWRIVKGRKLKPFGLESWSPDVTRLLSDLGFFRLLGVPTPDLGNEPRGSNVTVLPLISCTGTDNERVAMIGDHLKIVAETFDQDPSIYGALIEATYNSVKHGYPEGHEYKYAPLMGRWWATAGWAPNEGIVKIVAYDQGVGIPETLPRSGLWEKISEFLSSKHEKASRLLEDHSSMIEAAVQVARTSQNSALGRGQGLSDVVSVTHEIAGGTVRILSGKGQILYKERGNIERSEKRLHLGGTLIEWTIPA